MAELVFGFTVDIVDPDGQHIYRSKDGHRSQNGEAQVIFLKETESAIRTTLARKTFRLPNGGSLLDSESLNFLPQGSSQFDSRSPWVRILGDSFRLSAEELLKELVSKDFAYFLVLWHSELLFSKRVRRCWPGAAYEPVWNREFLVRAARGFAGV